MNFNFAPDTKYQTPGSLIPAGTLHYAVITMRGLKTGRETGGRYADAELTLVDGPFEGRKVWTVIMDPSDERNSENARTMGMSALQHIFEAIGAFDPARPETYARFADKGFDEIALELDGKRVPIKISVQKGKDGYQDKNQVSAWLSPNPVSSTAKLLTQLQSGAHAGNVGSVGHGRQTVPATSQQPPVPTAPARAPSGIATGQRPHWME